MRKRQSRQGQKGYALDLIPFEDGHQQPELEHRAEER